MQLKDIAKIAGVSPATISIVRKGKPGVSVRTRLRLQQMLLENGFDYVEYPLKPAPTPPPEKPETSRRLCLIRLQQCDRPTDGNESFISTIINTLAGDARRRGFGLTLEKARPDTLQALLGRMADEAYEGVYMLATELTEADCDKLAALPCPVVLVNSDFLNAPFSSVTVNNREIAALAVQTLYELGHRRIGFLSCKLETSNFAARLLGFREAMARYGLPFDDDQIYPLGPLLTDAHGDMLELLSKRGEPPTAFFSVADILAIGAIKALTERGYRVPEDVSLLGVGNIPFSAVCNPPLGTIAILCEGLGHRATSVLMHDIRVERSVKTKVMISGELLRRASLAPPREER